jgi:hypothetical protein
MLPRVGMELCMQLLTREGFTESPKNKLEIG